MMTLGERVRELRQAKKLTQQQLAEIAGIDFTYLSRIDKAGAYGLRGQALAFTPTIRGDYFSIAGLPLACLRDLLLPYFAQIGPVPPQPSFPDSHYCQS